MANILVTLFQLRAVPVVPSSFSTDDQGNLDLTRAVRKVDVELAALEMQFLGMGLEGEKRRLRFRPGVAGQERHQDLSRLQVAGGETGWRRLPSSFRLGCAG